MRHQRKQEKEHVRTKRVKTYSHNNNLDNEIGEKGAQIIGEALKTNTSLTSLDLRGDTPEKGGGKQERE